MMVAARRAGRDKLPVWKVMRPSGVRPRQWMDLDLTGGGKLSWPSAAFHTEHLAFAASCITAELGGGDDWKFWHRMNRLLPVAWLDAVLTRPQLPGPAGKGRGRRNDRA